MTVRDKVEMVSGVLFLVAFFPYIKYILKNRHKAVEGKPEKVTWFVYAQLDIIAAYSMYIDDNLNFQIIGAIIGASTVFVLALMYGESKWTLEEKLCLGFTGACLAVLYLYPEWALVSSLVALLAVSIPTFRKARRYPEKENKAAWCIFWVSCIFGVAAVPEFSFGKAAQPIMFLVIESTMMIILFVRPIFAPRKLDSRSA